MIGRCSHLLGEQHRKVADRFLADRRRLRFGLCPYFSAFASHFSHLFSQRSKGIDAGGPKRREQAGDQSSKAKDQYAEADGH